MARVSGTTTRKAAASKAKKQPEPEPVEELDLEETDEEELDLESGDDSADEDDSTDEDDVELDDFELEETPEEEKPVVKSRPRGRPKGSKNKPKDGQKPKVKRDEPKYGTAWLANHINEQLGTEYEPYDLRIILRRMAKKGELEREVGVERARYSFEGPDDPVVVKFVKMIKDGAIEEERKEKLEVLKERQANRGKKAKGSQKKASKVQEDDDLLDEDVDELDDDE